MLVAALRCRIVHALVKIISARHVRSAIGQHLVEVLPSGRIVRALGRDRKLLYLGGLPSRERPGRPEDFYLLSPFLAPFFEFFS